MTKKRLAIFLDGTWNTVKSSTNVSRLHDLVVQRDGAVAQLSYYDAGVGTGRFQWLRGGALGFGLGANVVEAYRWLVDNYADGDEIYIFGFSRGAYTARSLAGLVAKNGLLREGASLDAETLYRRYQNSAELRPIFTLEYIQRQGGVLTDEERGLLAASRRVPIMMVAVWDTVGSLGIPFGDIPGLSRRRFQFHHTRLSNLFTHAYHALAIDEHRTDFEPTLWTRFTPKTPNLPDGYQSPAPVVEQRWFVGAHADVGGGNPGKLPLVAAHWIAEKARAAGLALKPLPALASADSCGPVTDSFRSFMFGLYRLVRSRFYRVIGAERVVKESGFVDTANETIDGSVFDRIRADRNYSPPSLAEWASRRGVDPRSLHGAVYAATGKPL